VLQQLDTPQAVYARPANVFVAEFIGTPPMNMLRLAVAVEGDQVFLKQNGLAITAAPQHRAVLRPYAGREVIAGIRPEHLSERANGAGTVVTLPARVDVVETLGSEAHLYAEVAGENLIARVSADTRARPDEPITLHVDAAALHLFDTESEINILHGQMPQPAGA
jgi:ABC-type sugar transport system ATPase subunit